MNQKTLKIYHSCNPHSGYSRWVKNAKNVSSLEEADVLWIDGGADYFPGLYGQKEHRSNWNRGLSSRDTTELSDIKKAKELGKFIIGTCRGLQGIHIAAGGELIQDVSHPGSHKIKTHDGKELVTSSLHHQQINHNTLSKEKCKVLAWAENLSPYHKNGDDEEVEMDIEPEIVYYPEMKAVAWQGHPEMQNSNSPMVQYCQDLIDKLINNEPIIE